MHRTIGYLSKRFVQIRPGEERKVLLTFLYFFLIITAYYLIKPVSRSLVLGELGSRMVPYADLICALLMGPVVTCFARLVDRVAKPRLVTGSFWLVIGLLIVFWKLLAWPVPWIAGMFYIWVAIFSVLVVTLFWLVANDLYTPREAKRLFGFIGSGGILGGIVGSSIAAVGAQIFGTEHLLLLSAGLLLGCWAVVQELWHFVPSRTKAQDAAPKPRAHDSFLSNLSAFAKFVLQSRYLMLLILVVGLNKLIATLIYYQFNPFIEHAFPDKDARTTFTGMYFGGMNIVSFIIQFFFTSWILRRWGLRTALLALPAGVLVGSAGLLAVPVFWLAAVTELYDGSMNYSLQQTTKEMLYLPIDRSIRYKIKPFIDMVVFRFGKGIAAVIGIVLLDALHLPARILSCVVIPCLLVWLVAAVWLQRDYVSTIRTILQARAASRRRHVPAAPPPAAPEPRAPSTGPVPIPQGVEWSSELVEPFGSLSDGGVVQRKLSLIDRLIGANPAAQSSQAKELLSELTAYEMRLSPSSMIDHKIPVLKAAIANQQFPMAKRRQAIRLLARIADQATVDHLLGMVMVEGDAILRQEATKGLVRLRLRGRFDFPHQPIRRQILAEVAQYQRIAHVAAICRQHRRGAAQADDPVLALLRVLMEESVEQIFRLLMLLYRPEDVQLVYEQLRAPDGYVRADAIELLDNLVDPAIRSVIFPILDEDRFLSLFDEGPGVHEPAAAYRILQEAIWDHNCWLSVTTLCAIGCLRLTAMRQELERASRHAPPLISAAAKVALHLASLS